MNSRSGIVSLVVIFAAVQSACTSFTPVPPQGMPHFIGAKHVTIKDDDYLERYACANGKPMVCTRTSRVLGTSDCQCY
jgi:hypothetical protein